jgi:hypothetical protein
MSDILVSVDTALTCEDINFLLTLCIGNESQSDPEWGLICDCIESLSSEIVFTDFFNDDIFVFRC